MKYDKAAHSDDFNVQAMTKYIRTTCRKSKFCDP